jgi:hypothetical protein
MIHLYLVLKQDKQYVDRKLFAAWLSWSGAGVERKVGLRAKSSKELPKFMKIYCICITIITFAIKICVLD